MRWACRLREGNTPLVKLCVQVSDAVVDAKDVLELGGEGTSNGTICGWAGGGQLGALLQYLEDQAH